MVRAGAAVAVAGALLGAASPAAALQVPNSNWHQHPPGAPWLVAIAGEVVCPNATDKMLLKSAGVNSSPVLVAGVCMSETHVVHLRWAHGGKQPAGWSQVMVQGSPVYYKLTPRG